jgi:hypothetical protein
MSNTTYLLSTKSASRHFVGIGSYHWVIGTKAARKFTMAELQDMVYQIIALSPSAKNDIRVIPSTGGFKTLASLGI